MASGLKNLARIAVIGLFTLVLYGVVAPFGTISVQAQSCYELCRCCWDCDDNSTCYTQRAINGQSCAATCYPQQECGSEYICDECIVDSQCPPGCRCLASPRGNYCYCPGDGGGGGGGGGGGNRNPTCDLSAFPSTISYDGKAYYDLTTGLVTTQAPTTHTATIQVNDPDGDSVTVTSLSADKPACLQTSYSGTTAQLTPQGAVTGQAFPPLDGPNACQVLGHAPRAPTCARPRATAGSPLPASRSLFPVNFHLPTSNFQRVDPIPP